MDWGNLLKTPATVKAMMNGDLENFVVAATPGGIEAQEKRGQQALVESQLMPREYNGAWSEGRDSKPHLEHLGFTIIGAADDLFYNVQFPAGWTRQGTDHSMWSKVLDDKWRERIAVFYKAAFYDRRAHLSLERRYNYGEMPVGGWKDSEPESRMFIGYARDSASGELIYQTEARNRDEMIAKREFEALTDQAKAWIKEHYPQYEDPFAYWD